MTSCPLFPFLLYFPGFIDLYRLGIIIKYICKILIKFFAFRLCGIHIDQILIGVLYLLQNMRRHN